MIAERAAAAHYEPIHTKYDLSGVGGIPKYVKDYSNVLTLGHTGNLAVTFLGTYQLRAYVVSVSDQGTEIEVLFHVHNSTTIASGLRPPILGYTHFWQKNIQQPLNSLFASGPMSRVTQDFWWVETIPGTEQ